MQIYNYANYQQKTRRIQLINRKPRQERTFSLSQKSAGKTERVIKLPKVFSFRSFLIVLGSGLTETGNTIRTHLKAILICIIAFAVAFGAAFGILSYSSYNAKHSAPLVLQADPEAEIARLDKLMADFALENYGEISENGDISDIPVSSALFTQPVTFQTYKVQKGDTISGIAKKFHLTNISTLISVNDIGNVRVLGAGQKLKIPSIDGISYKVKSGDSLASIASKNNISQEAILDVNDLTDDVLQVGQVIFLPGAKLDQKTLSLAMGDQFICPIKAAYRMSSAYGARLDPITGKKSYHKGQDFACPTGTPIYASMGGTVIFSGESWLYGKHIIIDHGNGYQTLYAHMSKIIASKGTFVNQGTRIGLVGNTGYSTGPHLHFTVYKNGNHINPMSVLK
ncbi:MAG: M23 family metallopeptidase [Treponema sp.]|nr:M23 family metallopeptidase [Treponema sp.]